MASNTVLGATGGILAIILSQPDNPFSAIADVLATFYLGANQVFGSADFFTTTQDKQQADKWREVFRTAFPGIKYKEDFVAASNTLQQIRNQEVYVLSHLISPTPSVVAAIQKQYPGRPVITQQEYNSNPNLYINHAQAWGAQELQAEYNDSAKTAPSKFAIPPQTGTFLDSIKTGALPGANNLRINTKPPGMTNTGISNAWYRFSIKGKSYNGLLILFLMFLFFLAIYLYLRERK